MTKLLEQRTCNIIMCAKHNCTLLPHDEEYTTENAVIAYLSRECGCPAQFYKDHPEVWRRIVLNALYDYLNCARNPGYAMGQVFENDWFSPDLSVSLYQRIFAMFAQVQVRDGENLDCVNGFSEELMAQSDIDLAPEGSK